MTQEEMIEKYNDLYSYMATSGKKKNMEIFGNVMSDMFEWFVVNKQDAAEEFLDELCSVKWNNYLSANEANEIVSKMVPKAVWSYDIVIKALTDLGYTIEEEPAYNKYALWVVISSVYSDSAESIANIMGKTIDSVDNTDMLKACYKLAIDKLKDSDGKYNVRKYFLDDDE